ncbi:excitatory amino acid transporter 3-like [Sarcoptes scabiei]|nr:excitatory amino acid transporter 3-like [Sarcoptes scabiei]
MIVRSLFSFRLFLLSSLKSSLRCHSSSSKMSADLRDVRKPYLGKNSVLLEKDILSDPFEQFHQWFEIAKQNATEFTEINAVCLSTCYDGKPSSRVVLLKGYDPQNGFCFFTNYGSRKGHEIQRNPNVALLFYWDNPRRQVRVEGIASKVPDDVSEEYFNKRPKKSRIAARISEQSKPVDSRETLEQRQKDEEEQYKDVEKVPRPNFWGGFYVKPEKFEFWQGQSDRLHDRFVFERDSSSKDGWFCQRIQP